MLKSRREWRDEVELSSQATENAIVKSRRARDEFRSAEEVATAAQSLFDRCETKVQHGQEAVSDAERDLRAARVGLRATEANPKASDQEKVRAHGDVDSVSEAKARAEDDLSEAKRDLARGEGDLKEANAHLQNAENQVEQAAQLVDQVRSGVHELLDVANEQLRNSEGFGFRPIQTVHDDRFGQMEMRLEDEVEFLRSTITGLESCLQRLDGVADLSYCSTSGGPPGSPLVRASLAQFGEDLNGR